MKCFFLIVFCLYLNVLRTQTVFDWNTYTQGSLSYNKLAGGITMTTNITNSGSVPGWSNIPSTVATSSPKYINEAGHMPGLLISLDWADKLSSITETIDFSSALCGPVSFNLYDVNTMSPLASSVSQVFKDSVIISGKDASNVTILPTITDIQPCGISMISNRIGGTLSCGSRTLSVSFSSPTVKQIIIQYLSGRSLTWNNGAGVSNSTQLLNGASGPKQQHFIVGPITGNIPPSITTQPNATSICSTGSSNLSITAPAGPYQWQYFNGSIWANVSNGTPTGFSYANSTTNNLGVTTSGATTGIYPFRCIVGTGCTLNSSTANITITGPSTTGMTTGDWVWTGAQSVIYELAGNWLSWNGTVLSVPLTPPTTINNVRIKPTIGCVLNQPTIANAITIADAIGSANCKDIIIESGATLTYTNTALPNNAHFHITGNYTNQGTVIPGTGRVKFVRNSGTQIISDASGTATFYEMNVASTSTAVLSSSVTVTNAIRLPGVISTGTNRVYLNTTAVDNGSTTGFVTYTGHVFGNLRRRVVTNTNSYFFPVGVSNVLNTGRRLLEWINNSTTGITDLDCSVSNTFKGSGNNIDSQLDITNKAKSFAQVMGFVCPEAEWTLTPNTSITGGDYGLRLYLQNFALIADNKFTILKRPDNSTTFFDFNTFYLITTIPAFNNAGRIYSGGAGNAEKNGFTAFSKFVVATSLDVLPVELINYNIICSNEKPYISWQTISEQNNNYFSVYRSVDGESFQNIGIVNSLGNSSNLQSYQYIDQNPLPGLSYYRLSQTDFSNVTTGFEIKPYTKNCTDIPFDIVALSNPFENTLSLNLKYNTSSIITLSIYDNLGQIVKTVFENKVMEGETSKISINTDDLAQSVYYLSGKVNNEPFSLKLIKIRN